jgi:FkbM family methyltransferase
VLAAWVVNDKSFYGGFSCRMAKRLHGLYDDAPVFGSHDHKVNGEWWLWNLLKPWVNTIVDVGISTELTFPPAPTDDFVQHCFEPNPSSYNAIKQLASETVHINNVGLGEQKGTISYYNHSESIKKRAHYGCAENCSCRFDVNIIRLDDYVEEHKIKHIDFIKIDTEGYELSVLKGATKSLALTDLVQFEYGGTYPDNNIKLADVYAFLQQHGFSFFYLICPDYLCPCDKPIENYIYSNYLASKVPAHTLVLPAARKRAPCHRCKTTN